MPIEHYSYGVEFQAGGLPHIHGVAWIDSNYLAEKFKIKGDYHEYLREVEKFVDSLISCQIPDLPKYT